MSPLPAVRQDSATQLGALQRHKHGPLRLLGTKTIGILIYLDVMANSVQVPQAKRLPQWLVLLLPFDWRTWTCLGATFVICCVFALFYSGVHRGKRLEMKFEDFLFFYLSVHSEKKWEPTMRVESVTFLNIYL